MWAGVPQRARTISRIVWALCSFSAAHGKSFVLIRIITEHAELFKTEKFVQNRNYCIRSSRSCRNDAA